VFLESVNLPSEPLFRKDEAAGENLAREVQTESRLTEASEMKSMPLPPVPREAVAALRSSRIREVANAGMSRTDVLAFWFGESDEVTPDPIRQAGIAAIESGDTFYRHNLGIASLREAIAVYETRLHRPTDAESIAVTNSGMSALMIAMQALISPGDRVVVITPVWPNLIETPRILGAQVFTEPLLPQPNGWRLDLDRLLSSLGTQTRMLVVNSPANPTGWTMSSTEQRAVLEHCRRHGIWILSDDAYGRLFFAGTGSAQPRSAPGSGAEVPELAAPSFLDHSDPADRVISANTFSKTWRMTGWRLGWINAPAELIGALGTLIEYNTSCAPGFVQQAGLAALQLGEADIRAALDRLRRSRDFLVAGLRAIDSVECPTPDGAMYAFFRVGGVTDSLGFCKRLVTEAGLGLAPGAAFSEEAEGWVRWCFATGIDRLGDGLARFRAGLAQARR
jgi:aspartate/methionine/tyrosine aminotransferase